MSESRANELLLTACYLRIWQIIGDKKKGIQPIIPISKSSWWEGIKTGRYPAPVKLSPRVTAWKAQDIRALVDGMGGAK
jgi:prophage regulatory protein